MNEVIGSGAAQAMTVNARGTLIQDRWYQSFLPAISPEQEILYFLVPNEDVDRLMEQIVMVGQLRLFGAGSIFAVDCEEFVCTKDFPLWQTGQYAFEPVSFAIKFKADLVNLVHVTDRGSGEVVARAALRAGAQGATITYVRGYGLRDRLGLLRITKSHDKELITVVVDQYDKDPVFEAMSVAGRVAQPGRGLIFQLPVSKGLTNLASVFQPNKHSASIQQMVRAIDDLHGGTDWRARQLMVRDPRANEFSASRRGVSKDLKMLNVVSLRKDTEVLLNHLLDYGVSGASVSNWRFTGASSEQTPLARRSNREFGCISLIVNPHALRALCASR
ncbi:MAG: P-II family nitrogen regulator [Myxococcales bacterium]|nr:P-II family nitrogen regulator [Myxococcales bacterium]